MICTLKDEKINRFVIKNGTINQRNTALLAIKHFIETRNEEFQKYKGPRVQNLEKLSKFQKLIRHLKYVSVRGSFPEEILKGYCEISRISDFAKYFRHIPDQFTKAFIFKMISEKTIYYFPNPSKSLPSTINNLIEFSKNFYYLPSEILPTHNSPSHDAVLTKIMEVEKNAVGMEISVWMLQDNHYLTGFIDLILYIDNIIYVCDYKPEETPDINTNRLSFSFMRSIPQVASYALLLQREFDIDDIRCITFNKEGLWIFKPRISLLRFNNFIKHNRELSNEDMPWEEFFIH